MIIPDGRVELRWFRSADLNQMVELHHLGYPDENWTAEDFWNFTEKQNGQVVKVLATHQRIWGTFLYSLPPGTQQCRLRRLMVAPSVRRRGLATWAVNTLTSRRSVTPLRQEFVAKVREDNLPAQMLLKNLEFVVDPSKPCEDGYYLFNWMRAPVSV